MHFLILALICERAILFAVFALVPFAGQLNPGLYLVSPHFMQFDISLLLLSNLKACGYLNCFLPGGMLFCLNHSGLPVIVQLGMVASSSCPFSCVEVGLMCMSLSWLSWTFGWVGD